MRTGRCRDTEILNPNLRSIEYETSYNVVGFTLGVFDEDVFPLGGDEQDHWVSPRGVGPKLRRFSSNGRCVGCSETTRYRAVAFGPASNASH